MQLVRNCKFTQICIIIYFFRYFAFCLPLFVCKIAFILLERDVTLGQSESVAVGPKVKIYPFHSTPLLYKAHLITLVFFF